MRRIFQTIQVIKEVELQQLVMFGVNVGLRVRDDLMLRLFVSYNYDLTSYKGSLQDTDDDYVDLMFEVSWLVSKHIRVHSGYKKLLFYEDIDIDQFTIGGTLTF